LPKSSKTFHNKKLNIFVQNKKKDSFILSYFIVKKLQVNFNSFGVFTAAMDAGSISTYFVKIKIALLNKIPKTISFQFIGGNNNIYLILVVF
jgi:hypothetical protein